MSRDGDFAGSSRKNGEMALGMLLVDSGRNHAGLWRIRPEAPGLNQYLEWVERTVGIPELIEKRAHHAPVEESVRRCLRSGHGQSLYQKDRSRVVEIGNKSDERIGTMGWPGCVILVDRELSSLRMPVHDVRGIRMGLISKLEIKGFSPNSSAQGLEKLDPRRMTFASLRSSIWRSREYRTMN